MRCSAICLLTLTLAWSASAAGQSSNETTVVVGTVRTSDTNVPVAGALILITRATGASTTTANTATDIEGRFSVGALAPGPYVITVHKPGSGFVPARQSIDLRAGQVYSAEMTLRRGGVLAGRVLDKHGEPMPGTRMLARPARPSKGKPALLVGLGEMTNDLGEFRLAGLEAGEYLVVARPMIEGAIRGAASSSWQETFYPGTTDESSAQRLYVSEGETVAGIEFRIEPPRTYTISGVVIKEDGTAEREAMVAIRECRRARGTATFIAVAADGSFSIRGLSAGVYDIAAVRITPIESSPSSKMAVLDHTDEGTMQQVTIDGDSIEGLRLLLKPARR